MTDTTVYYLSIAQVAAHLAVSTKTVRRYIAQGKLPAIRLGEHLIRIPSDAVDDLGRPMTGGRP